MALPHPDLCDLLLCRSNGRATLSSAQPSINCARCQLREDDDRERKYSSGSSFSSSTSPEIRLFV